MNPTDRKAVGCLVYWCANMAGYFAVGHRYGLFWAFAFLLVVLPIEAVIFRAWRSRR